MQIKLHQTHHTIGDFDGIFSYIKDLSEQTNDSTLHLFPELFLTGYPLQDLCLQKTFVDSYLDLLDKINAWSKSLKKGSSSLLMGGLNYTFDESGLPLTIENVIYALIPGQELESIYTKKLLPNYDIYDEEKYFKAGDTTTVFIHQGQNIGLMICEDMWPSSHHPENPMQDLKQHIDSEGIELDLVVNLSASPFHVGKDDSRIKRASTISKYLKAPFIYVNRVGGEDEILFDGSSFIINGDSITHRANMFCNDVIEYKFEKYKGDKNKKESEDLENTWESLFVASLIHNNPKEPPKLKPLSDQDCETILHALKFGIQDYAKKCGFNKFTVALSGGIDSSIVLTIMRMILEEGQEVEAIYMPGFYSATLSYDLSKALCKNLGVKMYNLPIKFFHSAVKNQFNDTFNKEMEGLCDENIQSRLRGSLLYARSNQMNSMVLNTSNKSEIAVGYSTLYGDSVGALSVLGDLYKTEVFRLSEYINEKYGNLMPEEIISRPPSAELREDQEDSHSLPPYERLDAMLEGLLSNQYSKKDLEKSGFSTEEVELTYGLYNRSEYKRKQFCPIIKLKAKSFGFGYRMPICKK